MTKNQMEASELEKYVIRLEFGNNLELTKRRFFGSSTINDSDEQQNVFKEFLNVLFERQPEFKEVIRDLFEEREEPTNKELKEEDSE